METVIAFLKKFKTESSFLAIAGALQLFGILPEVQEFFGAYAEEFSGLIGALVIVLGIFGMRSKTNKLEYINEYLGAKKAQEIDEFYNLSK